MICALCPSPASTELHALTGRSLCLSCATAIADAMPRLKTQPCRRQAIAMRLQSYGIRVMPADKRLFELVEYGVTDEQITGACDMAKESIGSANLGYVLAILRNERKRKEKAPVVSSGVNEPNSGGKQVAPVVREDWERLGFANQQDYERWQWSYDQERRKGRKITEAESRKAWLSEAI